MKADSLWEEDGNSNKGTCLKESVNDLDDDW